MTTDALSAFFAARHVVLFGASNKPGSLGNQLAVNLVSRGFDGLVSFINPRGGTLFAREVYMDLAEVPGDPDLAVLLIPAALVPGVLDDCGKRGIRAAIISSGGFSETGKEGALLEKEVDQVVQRHGIRLIGPNCIGIVDAERGLDTTFLSGDPVLAGPVAFVSQSGAVCAAVVEWARADGFGLSRMLSLGNQIDVDETEALASVGSDPETTVVALYLEGVNDGRRFVDVASAVTRLKPVVALKVGRTDEGSRAAASHTGALAGRDAAYDAAFRRAGVMRAETSEELFDWVRVMASAPPMAGRRIAILTNAGGPGVAATDTIVSTGMEVARLGKPTVDALKTFLPAAASFANPVDMLAAASPDTYRDALDLLLKDPGVDGVIVLLPPPPGHPAEAVADEIIRTSKSHNKPVLVALLGSKGIAEAGRRLRDAGVPIFRYPERAVNALAAVSGRQLAATIYNGDLPEIDGQKVKDAWPTAGDGEWLAPGAAFDLVAAAGIGTAAPLGATTPDEAVAAWKQVGGPVALKLLSERIQHKTDVGGVVLDLDDEAAVRATFDSIRSGAEAAAAGAFEGVIVQPMVGDGVDLIVGTVRDPQFGPLVMIGSGGVAVETLGDVRFALAPVGYREATDLLNQTVAGRLLRMTRGRPEGDIDAAVDAIVRVSALAASVDDLSEMDINPLRVFTRGKGAVALDVRIRSGDGTD